jgi:hypothetical protein
MQTPVRFYITQNENRPVVRTIPVTPRPVEETPRTVNEDVIVPIVADHVHHGRVATLVRSAVKRNTGSVK